jgi:hypothetical protein
LRRPAATASRMRAKPCCPASHAAG